MVNQDNSRYVIQQLHLQRANQQQVKEFAPHHSYYDIEDIISYSFGLNSFIVDWQIPEPDKGENCTLPSLQKNLLA